MDSSEEELLSYISVFIVLVDSCIFSLLFIFKFDDSILNGCPFSDIKLNDVRILEFNLSLLFSVFNTFDEVFLILY